MATLPPKSVPTEIRAQFSAVALGRQMSWLMAR